MHKDYVCLDPSINLYHGLSNADKRRLLKLIDLAAYRNDLRKWWAAKKAQSSGKSVFEVNGEHFTVQYETQ
jgi:hypothetical protein